MAGEPLHFIRMDDDRLIEWDMEEYSTKHDGGKASWALQKGRSIGKKILMTGFILSSAPVVLPPLVVISAFGFAVSIPYGIFLASFACTQKIMSILLPNPETDFDGEFGAAYKDYEEKQLENADEMVEVNGYEEDIEENGEEEHETLHITAAEDEKDDELLEEMPIEVTTVVVEENGGQERASDIRDDEELQKETRGLLEKMKDEGELGNIPEANDEHFQGELMSRSSLEDDGGLIGENGDSAASADAQNRVQQPSDSVDQEDDGRIQNAGSELQKEDGVSSVVVIDVTEPADLSVSAVTIIEAKAEPNAAAKEELNDDEEKIKEVIDSVKKIIGYKGTVAHESCREEVNALYAFVGVEPPSELSEAHEKLQFLMSIVGVK